MNMINKKHNSSIDKFAGVEYYGIPGSTQECADAIMRLIQYNDKILKARILSSNNDHGFLLTINVGDMVGIKSGFASGYRGEGPRGFSYILQLLHTYDVEIEEYNVNQELIERLDSSSLTKKDIKNIDKAKPIRPNRWIDYIFEEDRDLNIKGKIWKEFPYILPLAVIDPRITDLAKSFWENPDEKLFNGYRRLEEIVRKKSGIQEHGAKLFSRVFLNSRPKLAWKGISTPEQKGRGGLFSSAYMAYRNPRAHNEIKRDPDELMIEFLLLNHLFLLENKSKVSRRLFKD
jgi:hypothetical protein